MPLAKSLLAGMMGLILFTNLLIFLYSHKRHTPLSTHLNNKKQMFFDYANQWNEPEDVDSSTKGRAESLGLYTSLGRLSMFH
jgi:hypothetical protein